MSNYIYLFLHFFKGYPVTLSIPATSVSPKTLPGFSLRPLCDTAWVCARFEPVVSNSCSTSGSSGEDTRDLSWVFKAGEEVYGERYWLIFMGTVGDGDFWLFDWRICMKM